MVHIQMHHFRNLQQNTSPVGLEPTTSGLEVRRAIHCATETYDR